MFIDFLNTNSFVELGKINADLAGKIIKSIDI